REVPEAEKPEAKSVNAEAFDSSADTVASAEPFAATNLAGAPAATPRPQPAGQENNEAGVPGPESGAQAELPGADDPASFAGFMMSVASNAASSLGMMEHPVTGKREVDLELGKHWIDVLGMLQQKTRGNLQPKEQQILESLLADLRMQFVSLTNAALRTSKSNVQRPTSNVRSNQPRVSPSCDGVCAYLI
ncbi:MAG: DUF1844 domain-containing protein, partial [Pyrinomonadaceae bacterium]